MSASTTGARARTGSSEPTIDQVRVSAFELPTDGPDGKEADATLVWDSTTIVVVELQAGDAVGLGYTYGDVATAHLIGSKLASQLRGAHPLATGLLWRQQRAALRNTGQPGVGALGLSAVDIALWDLKAKLLGVPLYRLLPAFHDAVPVYGSGGFCNYSIDRLVSQVTGWAEQGIRRVKIKTSRHPGQDPERLAACRAAIGDRVALMTDANGALSRKRALYWAHRFQQEWGVDWLEEPVSSEDLDGLRLVRDHGPPGLDVAAGEYGFVLHDFVELLEADAVDCLQADVTRCGGITGLLQVAGLCSARSMALSSHCAPAVSAHAFCGVEHLRHLEYFHDHVRLEALLFEGVPTLEDGALHPDPLRPGLGIQLKHRDAQRHLLHQSSH